MERTDEVFQVQRWCNVGVLLAVSAFVCAPSQRAVSETQPSQSFSATVTKAFVQDAPNCASEAVAKTVIGTYGIEKERGVFVHQVSDSTGITVTLRSGEAVRVTYTQLALAKRNSHFTLLTNDEASSKILDLSNLIYAVIAVRSLVSGEGPLANLHSLNDVFKKLYKGVDADYLFKALGYTIAESVSGPDSPLAYLYGNAVHAVFAAGTNFDQYGTEMPVDQFVIKHPAHGPVWKYVIVTSDPGSNSVPPVSVILACKKKGGVWRPGVNCD